MSVIPCSTNRTERSSPDAFGTKEFKSDPQLNHVYVKYRDQMKLNKSEFMNDFHAVDWNSLQSLPDIDTCSFWSTFHCM